MAERPNRALWGVAIAASTLLLVVLASQVRDSAGIPLLSRGIGCDRGVPMSRGLAAPLPPRPSVDGLADVAPTNARSADAIPDPAGAIDQLPVPVRAVPSVGTRDVENPVFSKDGRWLAYEVGAPDGGVVDLDVASITGIIAKDGVRVAFAGGDPTTDVALGALWHPGGLVVFEGSLSGGDYRLYIYTPGGGAPTELISTTKAPGDLTFPAVAPDGNSVAFTSSATGHGDVWAWDRTTDTMQHLTSDRGTETFPIYAPDSRRLLFDRLAHGTDDVFAVDVATRTETAFVTGPGDQVRPVFTGTGRVLLFSSARADGVWDVVSVDEQGQDAVILAQDVQLPLRARPAVSSDGRWVAWASAQPARSTSVFLTRIDGGGTVEYVSPYGACGEPALAERDGHTLLAYTYADGTRKLAIADVTELLAR